MLFLYGLPAGLSGLLIIGGCMAATLSAYLLFKRIFPHDFAEHQVSVAMTFLGVVATITSLLLAFSAVSVWESFNSADAGVMAEANDGAMLARDLGAYGTTESLWTREALRDYIKIVVEDEWPRLAQGKASDRAWDQLDVIFRMAYQIEATTPKETVLLGEIWRRINDVAKHRRERLHAAQSEVPATLWFVVIVGTILTSLFAFALPRNRFNITLLAGMSMAMGLVFFFIIELDHPFAGNETIDSEPFSVMINNMEKWDAAQIKAAQPPPVK